MSSNGAKVGLWIVIAILALMLFGSFLANVGLTAALVSGGGGSVAGFDQPQDQIPEFTEIWSYGYGDKKVVRIGLQGVIMRGRQERLLGSDPDMVEQILAEIRAATIDEEVEGIILEVDSPGGGVTPSDEIYAALEKFKRVDENRVILVFVRDLCASGGYYASMAGDYIMAEPTAIVGSVGVIMQTMNMKGLGDMIGLSSVTIASGENKDMLNPFEEVNPAHLNMLQTLVDSMQQRFAAIVMDSRGLEDDALLDGRVFSVGQALEENLIDGVGYWEDAVEKMCELLDVDELYLVRYGREMGFLDSLFASKTPHVPTLDLAVDPPRFMYLWKP
ncbi:signal peptide peptidase SppA [Pontiella agarivorans]|uniref:Signal peptide peptidase SppA n=1 Tax=Pontiella agarivorans TaxID=3038953 RepID=A0ABU5MVU9_9BACT|nr:signal peptide peptidase SppA [Pontiella agarivorans]MDZ8118297.1 signal peptide peptidase SppA [Pontiella agarivorans]